MAKRTMRDAAASRKCWNLFLLLDKVGREKEKIEIKKEMQVQISKGTWNSSFRCFPPTTSPRSTALTRASNTLAKTFMYSPPVIIHSVFLNS